MCTSSAALFLQFAQCASEYYGFWVMKQESWEGKFKIMCIAVYSTEH